MSTRRPNRPRPAASPAATAPTTTDLYAVVRFMCPSHSKQFMEEQIEKGMSPFELANLIFEWMTGGPAASGGNLDP